jgi:hypothetical protein
VSWPPGTGDDPADDVERDLERFARETRFPSTPPIADAVRRRLELGPAMEPSTRRGLPDWIPGRRGRPFALASVALIALTVSTVAAAVLGLPGLRFEFDHTAPTPNVDADPSHLRASLGIPTTLADAQSKMDFAILVPTGLGPPDEVYLGSTNRERGRVVLLYRGTGGPVLTGDIAVLVTEFAGALDAGFDTKWIDSGDTHVAHVEVNGARGFWFSGAPHVYEYLNEIAGTDGPTRREVGDVLVWERAGVVYRIESPVGLEKTRAIAATLR